MVKIIKGKSLKEKLNGSLINQLGKKFENCVDLVDRELIQSTNNDLKIHIMYFNNLVNVATIDENILRPICLNLPNFKSANDVSDYINSGLLYHTEIKRTEKVEEICEKLYDGNFAIVCEEFAYIFDAKKFEKRSVGDSSTEASIKCARDSFIEVAATNLSLVRRRIKSNKFKAEEYSVGNETATKLYVIYMEDVVNTQVLNNIRERIKKIDVSSITSPSMFEENLCERKNSILPQMQYTERPDKLCSCIVEGKIGLIVDGLPIVYIAPALFNMLLQDPEEYAITPIMASIKRVLRYFAVFISLTLAAFYIAITTFDPKMLPTKLIISIVRSKQDVPFQSYTEIMIMLIALEMILEAGARLPKNIRSNNFNYSVG